MKSHLITLFYVYVHIILSFNQKAKRLFLSFMCMLDRDGTTEFIRRIKQC